jgi:transposase
MDQTGWHKSKGLNVPKDIEIEHLPPYSPELNPVERLWQWLRRHFYRNRVFDSLDELSDTLVSAWPQLTPSLLSSVCQCAYLNM